MPAVAEILSILDEHSTLRNGRRVISYSQFAESRQICREHYGDLYDICFWPRVFFSFPAIHAETSTSATAIETRFLVKYVEQFERILQTRKELNGLTENGRLTPSSMAEFVARKLKPFYALKAGDRSHLMAACRFASCKFTFYHNRRGGATVMRSLRGTMPVITWIQQVEDVALGTTAWELEKALKCFQDSDDPCQERRSNWFSDKVIFAILDNFLNEAGGEDGVLSLEQFTAMSTFSTLSPLFSKSLFRHLTRRKTGSETMLESEGVMDLEDYANFVLAWNDRNSFTAVRYIFKIFDMNAVGYLTVKDILPFVQESVELLAMDDPEGVYEEMPDDIMTEILDMVCPAHPAKITAQDIVRCKNGYEIFGMMADAAELYQHEHKDD